MMMANRTFMTSTVLVAFVALFAAPTVVKGQFFVTVGNGNDNGNATDTGTGTDATCSSITDIICADDAKHELNALCEAIFISELNDDLNEDTWTIFAPTDEAFEALGRDNLDSLVLGNDTVPLTDLLLFHVIPGVALTSDMLPCEAGNNLVEMANGEDSRTKCTGGTLPVIQRGGSNSKYDPPRIIESDIIACNGVIYILDKVMLYEELPFEIPAEGPPAVDRGGDNEDEDEDEHEDEHEHEHEETPATPTTEEEECKTIADIACAEGAFSILCTLLQDSALLDDLSDGLWTVFAPSNAAFDDAPPFSSDTDIEEVLLGHVVANAEINFEDLECKKLIEMTNGKNTRTVCKNGITYQNGRGNDDDRRPEIVESNIMACNGIVHVVDQVILP